MLAKASLRAILARSKETEAGAHSLPSNVWPAGATCLNTDEMKLTH